MPVFGFRLRFGHETRYARTTMSVTTVQADTSQCLFEFLHMEIARWASEKEAERKEKKGEAVRCLESLGHRVGESMVERASRDNARFKNELEAVVFICKQFWLLAFNKQIDHLKTNHQDTYVLHDNNFRLLSHISRTDQYKDQVSLYLAFTCGLLTGALSNLGIRCQVTAEISTMPACMFQVKVSL